MDFERKIQTDTQYFHNNVQFYIDLTNKSVIGTAPRQFIDKKVFFRTSDIDPSVKETDKDEIYIWVSSAPDNLYPCDSKYVRATSILGI